MAKSLFAQVLKIAKQENCEKQQTIRDLVSLTKNAFKKDVALGMLYAKHLKKLLGAQLKKENVEKAFFYSMYFQVLCAETPYSLDSYFLALEFNREPKDAFYLPRRKQLLPIVRDLEDLLIHDKLDELFISQPTRTGKTTLVLFTLSWFIGMDSERTNLYSSCSSSLVNAFYNGISEILNDDITYNWKKIFPKANFDKLSMCNSKECYLDVDRKKRYHTFTGRSIDGESLNGACDCDGILIADDLVSGIEEALNKDRLFILNMKVNADFIPRAKMNCKKLWIGTRWSLLDPIGVRIDNLEGTGGRYKVHNRPALNDKGESNFDYLYGKGYNTAYYQNIKKVLENNGDKATFMALYQGEPIERSGYLLSCDGRG